MSLGSIGGFLVSKLVKPTKVFCSGAPHEIDLDQLLFPEAKSEIRAGAAVPGLAAPIRFPAFTLMVPALRATPGCARFESPHC